MISASARVVARLLGGAGNYLRRLIGRPARFAAALALAVLFVASPAQAQYTYINTGVVPDGQFTASNGNINYWSASSGYQIYDVASGVTTTIGLPPGGTKTNGYGDCFGVLDAANNLFYAATLYGSSDSDVVCLRPQFPYLADTRPLGRDDG